MCISAVIIKYTEGLNGKEKDVGRTTTVSSTSNPNWGDVMTFSWNKNKDQVISYTTCHEIFVAQKQIASQINLYFHFNFSVYILKSMMTIS